MNGLASYFVWLNRGKESLTLDLKQPEAKQILRKLLETADVFLHNLAPGAVDRLGFDCETVRAANPRLITCAMSGYGSTGPYRDKKAYDLLIQCETGLVSVTGTPETPAKVGISVADISGGMYAFSGVLTALYQRERTGEGAALEVALFDTLGEWMSHPMYLTAYGGAPPGRYGASHASIAPYGPFTAGDGACRQSGGAERAGVGQSSARSCCSRPTCRRRSALLVNAGTRVEHRDELHADDWRGLCRLDAPPRSWNGWTRRRLPTRA